MSQTIQTDGKSGPRADGRTDGPGALCEQVAGLREVLAASTEDREEFEESPQEFLRSCGATVLPGASLAEVARLGEVLESAPQGMRFVVLDSLVDETSRVAVDPNKFNLPIAIAPAIATFVVVVVLVVAVGSGADTPVVARRGGEQYSVVVDESFFSSAAAASLSEAGLSENRVRVLVRTAARQQEISPAGDGTVVLAYPYHGRTLELVGRVEGAALRIMDGTLTARAAADVHA